jgi:DNA-binding transcriptional LysR family regulator
MLQALLRPEEIDHELVLLPIVDATEEFIFALVYPRTRTIPQPARHFINTVTDLLSQDTPTEKMSHNASFSPTK